MSSVRLGAAPADRPAAATKSLRYLITSAAGFIAALDNLVVTAALPSIREDLGGGLEDLEWTVSAYTLTYAVLLMFGAALGDRFGRRRLFVIGLGIFTAASAAAALAPGMNELIAARAVQGLGAAILTPLTLTLLSAAVPVERRGIAFGVCGTASGVAVATGPLVGGTITEHLSWQWIFWAILLMFLGMFGAIFLLSQYLQTVGGYSPMEAGVRMLPWTAMPMIAGPLAGAVSDRIGGGPVVAVGMGLNAFGLALWALAVAPDAS